VFANEVGIGGGPANIDLQVSALAPTQLRQPLPKRRYPALKFLIIRSRRDDQANGPHPLRLLCSSGKRPRDHSPPKLTQKRAPPHTGLRLGRCHLSVSAEYFDSARDRERATVCLGYCLCMDGSKTMVLRAAQFGCCLIMLSAVLGTPNAAFAFSCGPGCH